MFVDSSYRIEFDLVREQPDRTEFAVDGGPLIYYVFCGPTPRQVVERFTQLTGRIPLPPRWALGNHHSRWGYSTADKLLDIARTFRARGIPLDALHSTSTIWMATACLRGAIFVYPTRPG
jgi:alpha-glucosidase